MARVFHFAFLACLPLAVALAVSGEWILAGVVLVVGTPLFWSLRNRSLRRTSAPSLEEEAAEVRVGTTSQGPSAL